MINAITNEYGKRDILISHYQACKILGITPEEIRELVQKRILNYYEPDMRGRFKVSMREVNKLKSEQEK